MQITIAVLSVWGLLLFPVLDARGDGPVGRVQAVACAPSNELVAAVLISWRVWITVNGGESWSTPARLQDDEGTDLESRGTRETIGADSSIVPEGLSGGMFSEVQEQEGFFPQRDRNGDGLDVPQENISLSVSDSGVWAVLVGDDLVTGSKSSGSGRSRKIEEAMGALFDGAGDLWVVARDKLLRIRGGTSRVYRTISGARIPGRGVHPGQIVVPGKEGLWIIETDGDEPSMELIAIGSVDAAGALVGDTGWYAAARGRIWRIRADGKVMVHVTVPGRVDRLLVDCEHVMRTAGANGAWRQNGLPMSALAVAVDTAGKVWLGTVTGPVAPGTTPSMEREVTTHASIYTHLGGVRVELASSPGPPPCRRFAFNPLPQARLIARMGRSDGRGVGLPENSNEEKTRTWAYMGVRLTWTFEPLSLPSCVMRVQRWHETIDAGVSRLAELWAAWRRAATIRPDENDPEGSVAAAMEKERLAELIRIASGSYPKEVSR
jgi:hypothetical protein